MLSIDSKLINSHNSSENVIRTYQKYEMHSTYNVHITYLKNFKINLVF